MLDQRVLTLTHHMGEGEELLVARSTIDREIEERSLRKVRGIGRTSWCTPRNRRTYLIQ